MNMFDLKENLENLGKLEFILNIIYFFLITLFLIEHNYCILILFKIKEYKSV